MFIEAAFLNRCCYVSKALFLSKPSQQSKAIYKLSKENNEAFQKYKQQLVLKSYSPSTTRTYTNEFMQFLQTIGNVPATEFTIPRIKDYLQYCFEKLKLSENTLHSRMNALYPVGSKKTLCFITFMFY